MTATLVSTNSAGEIANAASLFLYISPNGRFVAFDSAANNVVRSDTNNAGTFSLATCQAIPQIAFFFRELANRETVFPGWLLFKITENLELFNL
jgi:hypothetical protein